MHPRLNAAALLMTVAICPGMLNAQIDDPIPSPIVHRGLSVEIKEVARLPDSQGQPTGAEANPAGWARVSLVRDLPDGRRFANDARGLLYVLDDDNRARVYLNLTAAFPNGFYRSFQGGFIGFEFHPEFDRNGLLYTVHGEQGADNPVTPHFIPPGFSRKDVTFHSVITEWQADNPSANTFRGSHRELLRVGHVVEDYRHPFGYVAFNPTAKPGDPDYGLLYTSGSDLGFSNGGGPHAVNPMQTQRLDTLVGAILRFDPRSPSVTGGVRGVGDYTLPAVNKFAADGDPNTYGEIYAYGFRNAHRLSWDPIDGTLFATDIGMDHIEEINIVHEGGNYGWMRREGIFDNGVARPGGELSQVFPLSADVLEGRTEDAFIYPVAMYDHDEGIAITGGFVYRGRIPALSGRFIFGDIQRGRLFAAHVGALKAADDGIPKTVAPIEEIQLYVRDSAGNRTDVTMHELVEKAMGATLDRTDLHISQSRDGEILLTSRQDGIIRMLTADDVPETVSATR